MQRVFKFGTGDEIPEEAIHLNTITQTQMKVSGEWIACWFVWHYFLVEVQE